jgi:hypothetical protein
MDLKSVFFEAYSFIFSKSSGSNSKITSKRMYPLKLSLFPTGIKPSRSSIRSPGISRGFEES